MRWTCQWTYRDCWGLLLLLLLQSNYAAKRLSMITHRL